MDGAEPGRLLAGRYRLSEVLGQGGMGVVWRARDEQLDRSVAVKEVVWPADFTEHQKQTACRRATREAQMAARLNHPNVIQIFDIAEEDGHPWIVMELLPYRSLRDLVADEGPLAPAEAADVGLGILAALSAAQAAGIAHRDVKPANVLVGPDHRVVLTDFGIARATDATTLTTAGVLIGSPSYIAPERARGGPSGAAGDLWGLGASLYAAVEGHPPFERDSALASLTAVVADEPDPATHAGPLWPVISGLLRKDPDDRLTAAETERMLRHLVAPPPESPSAASTEPLSSRSWRPRGRLAGLVALAAVAVAAVAVAFALTSSPGHQATPPTAGRRSSAPPASHPASPSSASPSNSETATSGTGTSGNGALPAGWYRFTNSTGFSIGVPDGWQISHVGHYVYITDPDNGGIFLLIDQSDQPKPNPLADWQQQASARQSSYPDYHQIRLESVSYAQAEKAADWEFTYDRNGTLVHILNRNILANAGFRGHVPPRPRVNRD